MIIAFAGKSQVVHNKTARHTTGSRVDLMQLMVMPMRLYEHIIILSHSIIIMHNLHCRVSLKNQPMVLKKDSYQVSLNHTTNQPKYNFLLQS